MRNVRLWNARNIFYIFTRVIIIIFLPLPPSLLGEVGKF